MAKKKNPKVIWVACINLSGLYCTYPLKAKLSYEGESGPSWWSEDGDLSVRKLGLDAQPGHVKFASVNRQAVCDFLFGVAATMHLLRSWTVAVDDKALREAEFQKHEADALASWKAAWEKESAKTWKQKSKLKKGG